MRLPFVPRSTYDLLCADLERAEAREAAWVARHDALLARLDEVTRKSIPEPPKLPERTRDQVIEAIMARAGNNGQVRAHLSIWAMKQRREQVPDEKIIESILHWASPDDDDSSAGVP